MGVFVGVIVGVFVGVIVGVGVGVCVNGIIHPTINDHNVSTSPLSTGLITTFIVSEVPSTDNVYVATPDTDVNPVKYVSTG